MSEKENIPGPVYTPEQVRAALALQRKNLVEEIEKHKTGGDDPYHIGHDDGIKTASGIIAAHGEAKL